MIFTSFFFLFIRDQFQLKLVYIFRSKDAFILAVNFEIIWLYFLTLLYCSFKYLHFACKKLLV